MLRALAAGSEAAVYYVPQVLRAAGVRSELRLLQASAIVGLCKTSCVVLGQFSVDRFGRRHGLTLLQIKYRAGTPHQGLTLVHFSAINLSRFVEFVTGTPPQKCSSLAEKWTSVRP